jgi:hypothetical protein
MSEGTDHLIFLFLLIRFSQEPVTSITFYEDDILPFLSPANFLTFSAVKEEQVGAGSWRGKYE